MSKNYEKLEKEKRLITLPVPLGTTVYRVVPRCNETITYCPFSGGYGTSRCKGNEHCKAYIEEEPYSVYMYGDKSVYIKKESAEKAVERLNKRR